MSFWTGLRNTLWTPWKADIFKQKNPADAAMPYFDQIKNEINQGYNPYQQQGQEAYGQLNPQYSQMANDPASVLQSMMGSYSQSDAFKMKRDEALQAASNTAAAGGMRGGLADQRGQMRLASALQGEDMQQWLQNMMGVKGAGLQGLQGFYNTGYDATQSKVGDMTNALGGQGGLAFQSASNQNRQKADLVSMLMSALGAAGGGMAGGPMGASMGSQMGGQLGRSFMQ